MATLTKAPPITLPELSNDEIAGYSRHLILPKVGMEGQQKLKAAKVLCVGTFAALLAGTAYAKDRVLPDACGSDKVSFEVKKEKPSTTLAPPADGKSLLVFVQSTVKQGAFISLGTSDFTTRFGVDGNWAGAAGNNTYFTIEVPPGEHHLCASVQGGSSAAKRMIAVDSLTAEAGKTYYFEFTAERFSGRENIYRSDFTKLSEDEGKFKAKALEVSTSTPQK